METHSITMKKYDLTMHLMQHHLRKQTPFFLLFNFCKKRSQMKRKILWSLVQNHEGMKISLKEDQHCDILDKEKCIKKKGVKNKRKSKTKS